MSVSTHSNPAIRETGGDRVLNFIILMVMIFALVIVAYPLYFVLIASFSNPDAVVLGQVWLYPKEITLYGYEQIFNNSDLWIGYLNTIFYTVAGTSLNLFLTLTAAYALSRSELRGRSIIMFIFVFTMFFNGGLIPTYMLVNRLGLLDTYWALILPNAVSIFNVIIARTFFQTTLPDELLEAAKIDGCSYTRFFWSIALPLSKPIIAVMVIFYAVSHWNEFFNALIYLNDRGKYPLQMFLREILIQQQFASQQMNIADDYAFRQAALGESIKYGVIIVSSLPMLILYPLLQKYFVQGVMIGAIKG